MEFEYSEQTTEEISCREGQMVDVYDRQDPEWWLVGTEDGRYGLIPASYLSQSSRPQSPSHQDTPTIVMPESDIPEEKTMVKALSGKELSLLAALQVCPLYNN